MIRRDPLRAISDAFRCGGNSYASFGKFQMIDRVAGWSWITMDCNDWWNGSAFNAAWLGSILNGATWLVEASWVSSRESMHWLTATSKYSTTFLLFCFFFFCLFFFYGSNSWSPSATRWPNRLQVTRGRHDDVAMFTFIDATKRKDQSALGYLPHPP